MMCLVDPSTIATEVYWPGIRAYRYLATVDAGAWMARCGGEEAVWAGQIDSHNTMLRHMILMCDLCPKASICPAPARSLEATRDNAKDRHVRSQDVPRSSG